MALPDALLELPEPTDYELVVTPGVSWVRTFSFQDADGVALSLASVTGSAHISTGPGGTHLAAGTVEMEPGAATGTVKVTFLPAATAAIDDTLDTAEPQAEESVIGWWYLRLEDSTHVVDVLRGRVLLRRALPAS